MVEAEGAFRLRFDGVAVLGCDGVDAKVPDAEIDFAVVDDLEQGVFAEDERLFRGEFEPVAAG